MNVPAMTRVSCHVVMWKAPVVKAPARAPAQAPPRAERDGRGDRLRNIPECFVIYYKTCGLAAGGNTEPVHLHRAY